MNTDNNTHEYYIRLKESELRMNTHEERVGLETAKMLQKAGFDWECEYAFMPTTEMGDKAYRYNKGKSHNYNDKEVYPFEIYSAPTLDVVQRWLREVKGKEVEIEVYPDELVGTTWGFYLYDLDTCDSIVFQNPYTYNTYEEAQELGEQKCLTILLEEKK